MIGTTFLRSYSDPRFLRMCEPWSSYLQPANRTTMLHRTLLCAAILTAALLPFTALHAQDSSTKPIEVVFTPDMEEAVLLGIQEKLTELGVDLTYNSYTFDQGKLVHIDFSIKTPHGQGSAQGDIKLNERFGFHYGADGMSVGSLDHGGRVPPEPGVR